MLVAVQSSDRLHMVALPSKVGGAHWIEDAEGVRLVFAEGKGDHWTIDPCACASVRGSGGDARPTLDLDPSEPLVLNLDGSDGRAWSLVFSPDSDGASKSQVLGFSGNAEITVGRARDNVVAYGNSFVSGHHARLTCVDGAWGVVDLRSSNGTFVNGRRVRAGANVPLSFGDVVAVLELRIVVGSGLFSCNDPGNAVRVTRTDFVRYHAVHAADPSGEQDRPREFFYPALRFARAIEKKSFTVDAPPQPEQPDQTSLAMRIGPSLVMALASVLSASMFVSMMAEQGSSMMRAVPMVAMAVAMLAGSVLWPVLNARNQRKEQARKETQRRAAYSQYLSRTLSALAQEEALQREILSENRISVQACIDRAFDGDARLMDRTPLHADYLDIRLGLGEEPLVADIRFPDRHFSLVDDEVREAVDAQAREPRVLREVPIAHSLVEKHVVGVIGAPARTRGFVRGMIVQIAALCSYEDVKIVLLCDEADYAEWAFVSHMPHCFSNDKSRRYFACGLEETAELGMLLERVLDERRQQDRLEAREAKPYYVVVCASEDLADKADIVHAVVSERENRGISLIATARAMQDLPKECRSVIALVEDEPYLLDRDDPTGRRKPFDPDIFLSSEAADGFACALGKARLDLSVERQHIPARLGFLEMLGAGNVGHLNVLSRWRESNASATLACCVGVDSQGEPFLLNLHEKFHGPHGLIAGTTGSGKSEFIITYILSMAASYSPDDVAFVLIDYKGGGLAKAFDNEHVRLPHLAGVITNLDGAAITRSLVSIKSELKRRQALFNRARDAVGGDNVDIYDYLDLFRQGRMDEPCPHLFIVADEFAELKQQEPEFMDELISAARIGRSLGVHLILATQKPTGVVNDQIWSNARFKVCLKVADEADSREMIKRPDAAGLSQAGRFYLLVGYNEYFALGQSGYAGTRYVERERFCATKDDSVVLVSNTGRPLVGVKPQREATESESMPESVVVLSMVQEVAREEGLRARQLWLEPVPAMVTVDGLIEKYDLGLAHATEEPESEDCRSFELNPVIGELDDPQNQRQAVLTLPLSREGSALLYGTADSGVETVLYAALYSLLREHAADDLNVYAFDFGSEALRAFSAAPQVGDVICASDDEKARRFFDFIEHEVEERRALLSSYGGSFVRYRADGGTKAAVVVVVNDVSALMEAYPKLEDRLVRLTREAGRGGLYLIMTAAGTSSVRVRMRQTFRQVLACNLADPTDYGMIFGSMRGLPLPSGFARGLAKTDEGVFEFQGAHLCESGDDFAFAAEYCCDAEERARAYDDVFAPAIPVAPERVDADLLVASEVGEWLVPYGVLDDSLETACFDYTETPLARCVFQKRKNGVAFGRGLLDVASRVGAWDVALLDMAQLFGDDKPQGCAFATRKDEFAWSYMESLIKRSGSSTGPARLVIITGIVGFVGRLGVEEGGALRAFLKGMRARQDVCVLLIDAMSDASYGYEDWFKAHLTGKDGLWIGPGVDAQNVIGTAYSPGLASDAEMRNFKGYLVDGGSTQLVHLVTSSCEKEDDDD